MKTQASQIQPHCTTCFEACEIYTEVDMEYGHSTRLCLCGIACIGEVSVDEVKENGCDMYCRELED